MPRSTYFTPAVFKFLRELEENNDKHWFDANKDRYITTIRKPAKEFIEDFSPRLTAISEHFVADPRTNGGSLMRPYRDTRFSKDKTPYKTNVGIQFRHEMGKDVHAPGFYLHLEPGDCWAGVGMWRPEARIARRIRDRIHEEPDLWRAATHTEDFVDAWTLSHDADEMLVRVPREYADTTYPDDIRKKSFTAGARLTQKSVTSSSFDDDLARLFDRSAAYVRFLCDATGLPF